MGSLQQIVELRGVLDDFSRLSPLDRVEKVQTFKEAFNKLDSLYEKSEDAEKKLILNLKKAHARDYVQGLGDATELSPTMDQWIQLLGGTRRLTRTVANL